jgi:hypothetical protein
MSKEKTKNGTTKKRKNDKWGGYCVRGGCTLSAEEVRERTTPNSNSESIWDNEQRSEIGRVSIRDEGEGESRNNGEAGNSKITYPNHFRLRPTFTTEEEKSEWWAEATFKFRHWWATQSDLCGVYDGPTKGLHENFRRARIKQLGNGIVSPIVEIIGNRIIHHEFNAEAVL